MAKSNANTLTRSKKAKANELFKNNQLGEADALLVSVSRMTPADVELWIMRGLIHRKLGLFKEAENFCRHALKLKPNDASGHHVLGSALQCQGRMEEALTCYRKTILLQPGYTEAHYFLANALRETGAVNEAVESYRQAIKLQPDFVEALCNLGAALTTLGDTQEATRVLNRAITLRPDSPQILCNMGSILQRDGRLDEALAKHQQALHLNPNFMDAIINVAALLEKSNRLTEARAMVERELLRTPENPDLLFVSARLARRDNKLDEAIALLEKALPLSTALDATGAMHILLGQLYDRQNNTERAFPHLLEGNQLSAQALGSKDEDRAKYLNRVERMRSYLTPELALSPKSRVLLGNVKEPAFLFGFPRSGTTLLEQILDSHPAIQSMEEKPTVSVMAQAFEEMAQGRKNALAELTEDQIIELRSVYFKEVAHHIQLRSGSLLIDKNPLDTVNVHLIWRIFPRAKLILALRHPCDACFSCFMQNFVLNEANTGFHTLESSADIYVNVMRTWQEAVRILPLDYHKVRYEDLVADFEHETRTLLDFLEVGWDDRVLNHTEHAAKRGTINTPSYHQVTQPIYQHAKYRWKRYATQFEPVMPVLQPFIEYFGYAE
jgi:tetratricopeptide (TPR) repeat protein